MVRMKWYITSKSEYLENLKAIWETYRKIMGKNYPTMACVEVKALIEDKASIEIETTAVITD
jgi:enamine deaminase RidA (YjgF/YER057c/UK114 family)